jgi:hypothetical protein
MVRKAAKCRVRVSACLQPKVVKLPECLRVLGAFPVREVVIERVKLLGGW